MNLGRDFDTIMYSERDGIGGVEHQLHLTDWTFLEKLPGRRPFLPKIRNSFHTLTQISKIRIHVTFEMREPLAEQR